MTNISVRYIVDDVDAAVDFYTSYCSSRWRCGRGLGSRCFAGASCGCC